jgi:hypothetical protein
MWLLELDLLWLFEPWAFRLDLFEETLSFRRILLLDCLLPAPWY